MFGGIIAAGIDQWTTHFSSLDKLGCRLGAVAFGVDKSIFLFASDREVFLYHFPCFALFCGHQKPWRQHDFALTSRARTTARHANTKKHMYKLMQLLTTEKRASLCKPRLHST